MTDIDRRLFMRRLIDRIRRKRGEHEGHGSIVAAVVLRSRLSGSSESCG